jgi:hypothetical protein
MKRYAFAVLRGRVIAVNATRAQHSCRLFSRAVVVQTPHGYSALDWTGDPNLAEQRVQFYLGRGVAAFVVPVHVSTRAHSVGDVYAEANG